MEKDETDEKKRHRPVRGALKRMFTVRRADVRVNEEFGKLRSGFAQTRHLCPHDKTPMELDDIFQTDVDGNIPDGTQPERSLVCPTCSFTVPVSAMKKRLKEEAAPFKKTERMFTMFAFVLFVGLGGISLLNGNIFTLFGGLLFSLMLFMNAIFYRYRYWQVSTGRLFEARSPFSDFLREDLFGKL